MCVFGYLRATSGILVFIETFCIHCVCRQKKKKKTLHNSKHEYTLISTGKTRKFEQVR